VVELPPLRPAAPAAAEELSVDALVAQVLAGNPSLVQMTAAYRAASARYPQVTSLEDPMFAGTVGPCTFGPDDRGLEFAYRVEFSQKLPWPGKLRLRGDSARAEARAAARDVDDLRLRLVEGTKGAFYEYYRTARALEVNARGLQELEVFAGIVRARVRTGARAAEQDLLQVQVEIGREQRRRLALERQSQVAAARLNTLLSLPPDRPLAPPPRSLVLGEELPDATALRAMALRRRPDLRALASRVRAEQAALALACKEYYPDFEPFVMYDRFMGNTSDTRDLATMVGVRLNVPVWQARREGAVAEARARLTQRRAELERLANEAGFEVQQAWAEVRETGAAARLFQKRILPDAEQNVKAAQTAYATGSPFLGLIEAQRRLTEVRDQYFEVVAEHFRRLAALERATGGPLEPPLRPEPPGQPSRPRP
jgi:outer membrane protein TolC